MGASIHSRRVRRARVARRRRTASGAASTSASRITKDHHATTAMARTRSIVTSPAVLWVNS